MLNPPLCLLHPTIDALVFAINQHGLQKDYAVVKKRTKKNRKAELYKLYLPCDWGGIYQDKSKPGEQKRIIKTRLTGCSFLVTSILQTDGQ